MDLSERATAWCLEMSGHDHQGKDSKSQPWEFYENSKEYIPNSKEVRVRYISGGHFWSLESMDETTDAIRELLAMEV